MSENKLRENAEWYLRNFKNMRNAADRIPHAMLPQNFVERIQVQIETLECLLVESAPTISYDQEGEEIKKPVIYQEITLTTNGGTGVTWLENSNEVTAVNIPSVQIEPVAQAHVEAITEEPPVTLTEWEAQQKAGRVIEVPNYQEIADKETGHNQHLGMLLFHYPVATDAILNSMYRDTQKERPRPREGSRPVDNLAAFLESYKYIVVEWYNYGTGTRLEAPEMSSNSFVHIQNCAAYIECHLNLCLTHNNFNSEKFLQENYKRAKGAIKKRTNSTTGKITYLSPGFVSSWPQDDIELKLMALEDAILRSKDA